MRIGAWNIENLGTKESNPQQPQDLAAYILSSGVSVLALEEIHDDDQSKDEDAGKAPWKNRQIEQTITLLEQSTGVDWDYVLTAPQPANVRCQLTGVLWRNDRVTLKDRYRVPVAGGKNGTINYWTRWPEAFLFSTGEGKTDLALVPLHLKSGDEGVDARKTEAAQLLEALPAVKRHFNGENDIVLLGDTNVPAGQKDVPDAWTTFRDLNASERYTYIKPYKGKPFPPFDRIFVPEQPEFKISAQVIHAPFEASGLTASEWRKEHLKLRSDHLLVYCDVTILADDD